MGLWSIIVAEEVTNLCTNPSFETNANGWARAGTNTIAQSSAQSFKGAYSLLCTYQDNTSLAIYTPSGLAVSTPYYLSAWVYVSGWNGGVIRLTGVNFTGATITYNHVYDPAIQTKAGWFYLETKILLASDATGTFELVTTSAPSAGRTCYLDAVQFEQKSTHATTYCDGEQPGCVWTSTRHLSTSERSAQSRMGGREYNFDELAAYITATPNIGMPPLDIQYQDQALLRGSLHVGEKVLPRLFTLSLDAIGTSLPDLHLVRKTLINYLKPDAVVGSQPFLLRYTGANTDMPEEIKAVYAGGLEFTPPDGFTEKMVIALRADEPDWHELGEQARQLDTVQSLTSTNYILSKIDGLWAKLGTGLNGIAHCSAIGPDGSLYVGGAFTTAGGTTVNRIAKWSNGTWSALGTGPGLNGVVYTMTFGPDGSLYVGGAFDDVAGGVGGTLNRVAKWNGTIFSAIGSGFNDWVYGLTFGLDGTLYAVGQFTTSGVTTVNRIAKSANGSGAWAALTGAPVGLDGAAYAVVTMPNGDIVVGGAFTSANGVTVNRVTRWNGTAFNAMAGGMANNSVLALVVMPSGDLYAGGSFTAPSGIAGSYISKWNGASWLRLNKEVNAQVDFLAHDPDGNLIAGGSFTQAGDLLTADRIAIWNGSSWSAMDVDFPGTPTEFTISYSGNGDMYIGFGTSGTATTSALTNVTNSGTTRTYPRLTIKRSGGTSAQLVWLKNETTGKALYFNYSLLDGETLEIDLTPGARKITSSMFGLVWSALLSNSDAAELYLNPGNNSLTFYCLTAGTPTMTAYAVSPIAHWSADGAAV